MNARRISRKAKRDSSTAWPRGPHSGPRRDAATPLRMTMASENVGTFDGVGVTSRKE